MSDTSKRELIREARAWAALIGTKPKGARELFNRLADALESDTVFEQAHTITDPSVVISEGSVMVSDDERAIAVCIDMASTVYGDYDDAQGALSDIHMMLAPIAAGFRRTAVQEPSAEDHPCGDWPAPCNCDDPETHDQPEPQTEPTDAQVEAALIAYWGGEKNTHLLGSRDGMRAALRAAAVGK